MLFLYNIMLALVWMALTGQLTYINFFAGLVIGYVILWLSRRAWNHTDYFRKVPKVIGLILYFIWQLIEANFRVAYDILTPKDYMNPAVVAVPLDLQSDIQIISLANMITLTPGTLSLDYLPEERTLYVHVMHLKDADEFRREIKEGFEQYIKEVST